MPVSSHPAVPPVSSEIARARKEAVPKTYESFRAFNREAFSEGKLDVKTKQLIAVAAAHVTQCPWCIEGHTRQAIEAGAAREEIMEAIWIAAEMRAGAAYAHSAIALEVIANDAKQERR
ncbi:MAG: carboxymuconolactone decarboxylase family protein [Hyphomicrobiaceae bacterium]|nr:carboxymuconolactone decarboxylase family protein [Hyphomicrobiaceae bacterium]